MNDHPEECTCYDCDPPLDGRPIGFMIVIFVFVFVIIFLLMPQL